MVDVGLPGQPRRPVDIIARVAFFATGLFNRLFSHGTPPCSEPGLLLVNTLRRPKKETAIWGSVENWKPRMCNRQQGQCEAKRKHGKHLMSIGNNDRVNVGRTTRLMIPPELVRELFQASGINDQNSYTK